MKAAIKLNSSEGGSFKAIKVYWQISPLHCLFEYLIVIYFFIHKRFQRMAPQNMKKIDK